MALFAINKRKRNENENIRRFDCQMQARGARALSIVDQGTGQDADERRKPLDESSEAGVVKSVMKDLVRFL